jgi:Fic family protein
LEAVKSSAEHAINTAERLRLVIEEDHTTLHLTEGRQLASLLKVHRALLRHPIAKADQLAHTADLTRPAVRSALARLIELGMVEEISGRQRHRLYVLTKYMAIIQEETEPL